MVNGGCRLGFECGSNDHNNIVSVAVQLVGAVPVF